MILKSQILFLLMFLGLLTSPAPAWSQEPSLEQLQKRMGGETVLAAEAASLLNPICRFEEHPWFELSNLRPGSTLSTAMELDFVCTGPLDGQFHLVVLTNGKRFRFAMSHSLLRKRRGTFRCMYSEISGKSPFGADVEAYVELTDSAPNPRSRNSRTVPDPIDPLFFKVSESASRGSVSQPTYARAIRASELETYQLRKKKYGPPPPPPEGTALVKNETPLVPGTPVLAAFEGDWLKAEVLAAWDSGRHVVHWPELGHLRNQTLGQTHLAISHETLQRLRSNPEAFSPSVKLPLNSLQPPPEGYIVLPDEVSLLPGVPVKVGAWDYTFLRENAGQVSLLYNTSAREYVMPRRRVVIHEEVIGSLKREGAAEKYSKRLQELQSSVTQRLMRSRGPARTYQINIPLPAGYQRITAETPLQVETDCQACWGRRWSPVVVKSLFENGDVGIVWTKWPSTRIERVTRESLIVSDDTLAKLAGDKMPTEATKTPAEPSGTAENFTLVLVNAGDRPVRVIKEVMEIANLDLSMAAQATRELPLELKRGLSSTEAEKWKTKLESVGATVRLDVAK